MSSTPASILDTHEVRVWARGTKFAPDDEVGPFAQRERDPGYEPLEDHVEENYAEVRRENIAGLAKIGIEVLSEPALDDPDVKYAGRIFDALVTRIRERHAFEGDEENWLREAFSQARFNAAYAVARAWLAERKSIPLEV